MGEKSPQPGPGRSCSPRDLKRQEERKVALVGIEHRSPRDYEDWLVRVGYEGQHEARQAACLAAYRHVQRIRRIYLEGKHPGNLPAKPNLLFIGPTGCGKTYLLRLLFRELLKLPCVIVDSASLTESGYIGASADTALKKLYDASSKNPRLAEIGVVCFDEIDKLAGGHSSAVFGGEGTTKDVGGWGVQQELLNMVEGGTYDVVEVPGPAGMQVVTPMSTRDVLFVASGAFSGLRRKTAEVRRAVGFGAESGGEGARATRVCFDELVRYGFMPELLGRFTRLVHFAALDRETLRQILMRRVLRNYAAEFAAEGLELSIDPAAIELLLDRAQEAGTGARGLEAELSRALEQQAFQRFGEKRAAPEALRVDAACVEKLA